jgi:hypothetical protein
VVRQPGETGTLLTAKTMNAPNIEKFTAELQAFKKGRITTVIEIRLDLVFAIAVQSQLIYSQQKNINIEIANKALETGLSMQSMFRTNSETHKILSTGWNLPESEIYKILEIATR